MFGFGNSSTHEFFHEYNYIHFKRNQLANFLISFCSQIQEQKILTITYAKKMEGSV